MEILQQEEQKKNNILKKPPVPKKVMSLHQFEDPIKDFTTRELLDNVHPAPHFCLHNA